MAQSSHEQAAEELHEACKANDLARIQELFRTKPLSAADATNELKRGLGYGSEATPTPRIRCLLEHGADLNVLGIRDIKSLDVFKLLAEFGFDIKTKGHLILHTFADSQETLDWLLDQGVDINQTDCKHDDHSLKVLNEVAARGDIPLFDHLVSRGADPLRSLALHFASKCQDPSRSTAMLCHLLDEHSLDINTNTETLRHHPFRVTPDTGTPLVAAIANHNLPVIQVLLKKGAGLELKMWPNPIYQAIGTPYFDGSLPALQILLDAGADKTVALNYAATRDNFEAARICLEYGASPARSLEWERARREKAAAEEHYEPDCEDLSDGMVKFLEEWKPSGENAASNGRRTTISLR